MKASVAELKQLVRDGVTAVVRDVGGPMTIGPYPVDYVSVTHQRDPETGLPVDYLTVEFGWVAERPHYTSAYELTVDRATGDITARSIADDQEVVFSPVFDPTVRRRLNEWARGEGRLRDVPKEGSRYAAPQG